MRTRSKEIERHLKALLDIQKQLKELTLTQDSLKAQIRAYMAGTRLLEGAGVAVLIEVRQRTDLDKTRLAEDLGPERLKLYQKVTQYEVMLIKSVEGDGHD